MQYSAPLTMSWRLGEKKPKLVVYEPSNRGRTHSSVAEALVVLSGNGHELDYNLTAPIWVGKADP